MTLQKLPDVQKSEPFLLTKEGLDTSAAQLKLLEDYVRGVLRENQDYGPIPGGGDKPTLLKPGAANVIAAFNCYPEPHIETETIDLERGLIFYRVRVDVLRMDNGQRRATGQGSCSSYEKKYRYRFALATCPTCGKENIRVSRDGGFYCWRKTGGCGATFHNGDARITRQAVGQVINDDPMEQANTILKMAIKRAEVDAALRLPGVARFFTQDLEDSTDKTQDAADEDEDNPAQRAPASKGVPDLQAVEGGPLPPMTRAQFFKALGVVKAGQLEASLGMSLLAWEKDGRLYEDALAAIERAKEAQ